MIRKTGLVVISSLIMLAVISSCKTKTDKKEEAEVETEVKVETKPL